jgi:hypothetical protein
MIQVSELKGFKSFEALQAFHKLMLGLKMLPSYALEGYEDFYARVAVMDPVDQEKLIREAAIFVELSKAEVDSLLAFTRDANGVPYDATNSGSLTPDQFHERIVAVCKEIGKIKITLVSESEKKN